ncbi:MAG: sensor histidine kinase [Thioalkalivibrio sp.]
MQPSLQQRIRNAWVATVLIMTLVSLFAAERFYRFEAGLDQGDVVADLLRDSLEMRRHEKRYYVDGDAADLQTASDYARTSLDRLNQAREHLEPNARPGEVQDFEQALARYIEELSRLESTPAPALTLTSTEDVRSAGSEVSSLAKMWVQREREALHASLQRSRWQLVAVLLLAAGLVLLNFWWLARQVLLPLQRMVRRLGPIAEGRYRQLEFKNDALEFRALAQAVNHMLDNIEQRERKRAHTERLMALGVLVSGVAHELNNPLGNIASSLDLYKEQLGQSAAQRDEARLARYLRQAREETDRAHRIVRLLLDHARDRAGERLDCSPTALSLVVSGALEWSRAQMRNPDIHVSDGTDMIAWVAREPLQQALVNLLRNADQAAGPDARILLQVAREPLPVWNGEGRYSLGPLSEQAPVAPDGRRLTGLAIRVSDSGPGVRPGDMEHLFEPFYRANRRHNSEGSGLGLYLVAQIMDAHGGAVSVENGPTGGAVFTLWLPEDRDAGTASAAGG